MVSAVNPLHDREPRWLAGMPKVSEPPPRVYSQMTLGHAARVISWAFSLREFPFPTVQDIMTRWDCSRASAYRWRAALADGFGLELTPNPAGTRTIGASDAPVHSRRAMTPGPYRAPGQKPKPSAVSWALRQKCETPAEKLVLVAMADLSNSVRECFPGPTYLAEITGLDEPTVKAAIASLRGVSLIAWTGRNKGPKGRGPIWVLAVDAPVSEPPESPF